MAASVTHKAKAGAQLTGTEYEAADAHDVSITAADVGAEDAGAVATHEAAADPHAGYRLESADHSHASTGLQAGKLAQANTHQSPDTDSATTSLHHTLGTGANQAAAGDHTHSTTLLASARFVRTAGDYSITGAGSTAFADVDATNLALTITTGARKVNVGCVATGLVNNTAGAISLDVLIDGSLQGGANTGILSSQQQVASKFMPLAFTWQTAALSAGSHTFKLQWRQANSSHTATLKGTDPTLLFWVQELYA